MKLTNDQHAFLLTASSKVLATQDKEDINAVPVSVIESDKETITLFDFFMNKTRDNIIQTNKVSLVVWEGTFGFQIKGKAAYDNQSSRYHTYVEKMKEQFPSRTLNGLVIITIDSICDVSLPQG
jgi:predicted pyridoxine 5'-phosphate oxidase superfamily flavin-nucleotide-binding protein